MLVVDEIFDYLDDANLVAAQYYISNLIKEAKEGGVNIYTLIFTHLNPLFFKNYAFRDQKVYYLGKRKPSINPNFRRLIVKREDPQIKAGVDHYFLHYAPSSCDLTTAFKALGLPESWGKSEVFAKHIETEWQKYSERSDDYDPFAVSCHIRVTIEKTIFEKISDPAKAAQLIAINGTKKKLEYAASIGIEVPDVCFLLGIIYNEGLHIKEHVDNSSPIVSKLENLVIRRMIGEAIKS